MGKPLSAADILTARLFRVWRRRPGEGWGHYGPLGSRQDCLERINAAKLLHPGVAFQVRRRGFRLPMDGSLGSPC